MNEDELEIRELVETWMHATEAHQHEKILELMDEDAVFLSAGQPALRGKRTFEMALQNIEDFKVETKSRIREIKVSGDLAYCWNHVSVDMKPTVGRNIIKRTGNILSILEKKNGRWVITRDANMLAIIE